MKSKTTAILLLYFIVIIFCGFNSFKSKLNIQEKIIDTTALSLCQDSLKLLDDWKIDYGFNNGITFWGDTTYNLYKSKVKWQPGVAMQVLELKSANSFIFIKFTSNHEIERVNYTSLKRANNNKDKIFYSKNNYQSDYFGFKIGDSLPFVLKKLKGVDYKMEKNYPSKKDVCVNIHGLVKFEGIANTTYDEYMCSYCFVNKKLDLIEINYFRDVPHLAQGSSNH
jgi:hypothetical protein